MGINFSLLQIPFALNCMLCKTVADKKDLDCPNLIMSLHPNCTIKQLFIKKNRMNYNSKFSSLGRSSFFITSSIYIMLTFS